MFLESNIEKSQLTIKSSGIFQYYKDTIFMTTNLTTMLAGDTLTMSSREIAELCEKEHFNVMRDIRKMLTELHGEGGYHHF